MINYAELIRGFLEFVLILFLYGLAKKSGRDDAEKAQLIVTLKGKDFYDRQMDARVARVESNHEDWKKYIQSLDFDKLSDLDIQQLREGKTIEHDQTSAEFDPTVNKKPAG